MSVQAATNGTSHVSKKLLAAHIRVPDHVVYRTFVRETVVLNLATGRYHGINPTGGRILDLLADDATLGSAAQVLADEHQRPLAEVERDVCTFCEELRERGLIEVSVNGSR
jgi:coenzyme PQQ synthesis protein D (PqqD)